VTMAAFSFRKTSTPAPQHPGRWWMAEVNGAAETNGLVLAFRCTAHLGGDMPIAAKLSARALVT